GFGISIEAVDDDPGPAEAERRVMRVGLATEIRIIRRQSATPVAQCDRLWSTVARKGIAPEGDKRTARWVPCRVDQRPAETSVDVVGAGVRDEIGSRVQRPRQRIGHIDRRTSNEHRALGLLLRYGPRNARLEAMDPCAGPEAGHG